MEEMREELKVLSREKEVLSYKRFWDGADYKRNREITDRIYKLKLQLADNK